MAVYGYARVSTDGQTLASQEAQLVAAGCVEVFAEKVSGARTDRVELPKVMRRIEVGDMLIVTRLDRLARSTRDLLNILHVLAEKGAKFRSLAYPECDTSTPQGGAPDYRPGRFRYLRAASDQGPYRRRSQEGQGAWGAFRSPPEARPASTPRGTAAACQWRNAG